MVCVKGICSYLSLLHKDIVIREGLTCLEGVLNDFQHLSSFTSSIDLLGQP